MARRRRALADRVWERVDRSGGPDACWPWTGHCNSKGYGKLSITSERNEPAHRIVWQLEHGPIPDGMMVLHHCDNPPCCSPAHLWLGTNADNVRDMHAKGRAAPGQSGRSLPGELNGHAKLTAEAVQAIRAAAAEGVPQPELARQHGVSRAAIRLIVLRKIWRHVP